MRITCTKEGNTHMHYTVAELAVCAGSCDIVATVSRPTPPPKAAASGPHTGGTGTPAIAHPTADPTGRQLAYIRDLGGSWRDAHLGNRAEAGELIGILKGDAELAVHFKLPDASVGLNDPAWDAFPQEAQYRRGDLSIEWDNFDEATGKLSGKPVLPRYVYPEPDPDPVPVATRKPRPTADKLKVMLPILATVPDGYYGVEMGDGRYNDRRYLRLSRPKNGRFKSSTKIQVVSGDRLEDGLVVWPSGSISVYAEWFNLEEYVLALMSNHRAAARLYAKTIGKCARCNTRLTDERSRHYGIGPECEKHWPHYISEIDQIEAEEREANR